MKKLLYLIIFLVVISFGICSPTLAFKASETGLTQTAKDAGFGVVEGRLPEMIGNIINAFLTLLGIILMIVILYGGIKYMIAGGNEEEVAKAKKWIINGVVGVIIVALAFAISNFVIARIGTAIG